MPTALAGVGPLLALLLILSFLAFLGFLLTITAIQGKARHKLLEGIKVFLAVQFLPISLSALLVYLLFKFISDVVKDK